MKLKTICRILAYIGLVCALAFTVCLCILLFNLDSDGITTKLGAVTLVCFVATLIFLIPAYVLNKRAMADEAAREEANGEEDRDGTGESTDEDKKDGDAEGSDADGVTADPQPNGDDTDKARQGEESGDAKESDGKSDAKESEGASDDAGASVPRSEADDGDGGKDAGGDDVGHTEGQEERRDGEDESGDDKPLGV